MNLSQPAIELQDVGVLRDDRWILGDISTSIPVGACAALLGPNGCGKSTLMRVISGYLWATRGVVRVLGETFGQTDIAELRKDIRLVQATGDAEPEPEMSTTDVVLSGFFGTSGLFARTTHAMHETAASEIERVGLSHVATHAYGTLSAGERMRCQIARALVVQPKLLLLDEPTAGLDLVGREHVLGTITSLNETDRSLTIVLTTHHLEELPASTSHVLLLSNGKTIAYGKTSDVLTPACLSQAYGYDVNVTQVDGRFFATAQVRTRVRK